MVLGLSRTGYRVDFVAMASLARPKPRRTAPGTKDMKITRIRARRFMTNEWVDIPGFSATCSDCGRTWGFANISVTQARKQGLDKCPRCGRKGVLTAVRKGDGK